jgi:hypothetical protein
VVGVEYAGLIYELNDWILELCHSHCLRGYGVRNERFDGLNEASWSGA